MPLYVRKKEASLYKEEHRIGNTNYLLKIQVLANTQVIVLELTPAQWLYPKVCIARCGCKVSLMAAVTMTVLR